MPVIQAVTRQPLPQSVASPVARPEVVLAEEAEAEPEPEAESDESEEQSGQPIKPVESSLPVTVHLAESPPAARLSIPADDVDSSAPSACASNLQSRTNGCTPPQASPFAFPTSIPCAQAGILDIKFRAAAGTETPSMLGQQEQPAVPSQPAAHLPLAVRHSGSPALPAPMPDPQPSHPCETGAEQQPAAAVESAGMLEGQHPSDSDVGIDAEADEPVDLSSPQPGIESSGDDNDTGAIADAASQQTPPQQHEQPVPQPPEPTATLPEPTMQRPESAEAEAQAAEIEQVPDHSSISAPESADPGSSHKQGSPVSVQLQDSEGQPGEVAAPTAVQHASQLPPHGARQSTAVPDSGSPRHASGPLAAEQAAADNAASGQEDVSCAESPQRQALSSTYASAGVLNHPQDVSLQCEHHDSAPLEHGSPPGSLPAPEDAAAAHSIPGSSGDADGSQPGIGSSDGAQTGQHIHPAVNKAAVAGSNLVSSIRSFLPMPGSKAPDGPAPRKQVKVRLPLFVASQFARPTCMAQWPSHD